MPPIQAGRRSLEWVVAQGRTSGTKRGYGMWRFTGAAVEPRDAEIALGSA
jgi:hypothetical protein